MTTPPVSNEPCVIGPQTHISGRITGSENLIIEGRFEGSAELGAHLVIEEPGVVTADVQAIAVTVRGQLHGNVHASESVTLEANAVVVGDIHTARISIADGARFKGNIQMDVRISEHSGQAS